MAENLLFLLLTALPLMGSPGPATLSIAAMGTAFGFRRSLPYLAGICSGTGCVLLLIASGVTGILLALPGAVHVVTALAALYILWLAWKIATAPPLRGRGEAGPAASYPGGLFLALANPKAYAAIGATYSSTRVIESDLAADTAVKIAALLAVVVGVNLCWLAFGSAFSRYLSSPRLGRAVNVTFAVLLVISVAAALLV